MASRTSRTLDLALKKLAGSGRLPGEINSEEQSRIRRSIREQAIFSAKVHKTRILEGIRETTEKVLRKEISPMEARDVLRGIVEGSGYEVPEGLEGSIQDLTSDQRLDLIVQMNRDMARGYGRYAQAQATLDEFPFWELYRQYARREPRDWASRWVEAGGQMIDGKMMAPVNSLLWVKLSEFGTPYPPFDWGSGMGVKRVSRKRVEEAGVKVPKQKPKKLPKLGSGDVNLPSDKKLGAQLLKDLGPGYKISRGKIVRA